MALCLREGVCRQAIFLGAPAQRSRELTTVESSRGGGPIALVTNMDSFLLEAHLLHWTSRGPFLPPQTALTMVATSLEATPTPTARDTVSLRTLFHLSIQFPTC